MTWPHRGDTALDRARIVARTCLQALGRVDPRSAAQLVTVFDAVGETWLAPPVAPVLDPGAWVHAERIAEVLHIEIQRIRKWGQRGQVLREFDPADGRPLFRLQDCQARLAVSRRARAAGRQRGGTVP